MWYAAVSPRAGDLNFPEYNCYAESEDAVTWVKPDLNLYEYKGSKQNNIVYSTGGTGLWFYRFGVFRDEEDADPGKRYKGLGAAASPNAPTGLLSRYIT